MKDLHQKIKLIAIDLDGTLLNNEKELSSTNSLAIKNAQESGLKIVLASGRPPFAIFPIINMLGITGYFIACNGALLIETRNQNVLVDIALNFQDTKQIISKVRKHDLNFFLYKGMDSFIEKSEFEEIMARETRIKRPTIVEDLIKEGPLTPNKVQINSGNSGKLERILRELRNEMPQINLSYQAGKYIEIMHKGATKEVALAYACGLARISPAQVAAIGNAENDLGMLGFSSLSVSVENATHYIQEVSKWLVSSNDQDGVAQAINRILESQ